MFLKFLIIEIYTNENHYKFGKRKPFSKILCAFEKKKFLYLVKKQQPLGFGNVSYWITFSKSKNKLKKNCNVFVYKWIQLLNLYSFFPVIFGLVNVKNIMHHQLPTNWCITDRIYLMECKFSAFKRKIESWWNFLIDFFFTSNKTCAETSVKFTPKKRENEFSRCELHEVP